MPTRFILGRFTPLFQKIEVTLVFCQTGTAVLSLRKPSVITLIFSAAGAFLCKGTQSKRPNPVSFQLRRKVDEASGCIRPLLHCLLFGMLSGCALGPDFVRPAAPEATGYLPDQALTRDSIAVTKPLPDIPDFKVQQDIPADWWTVFRSAPLNHLIERAFEHNPTLESAQAALREAQQNTLAQQGFFYPSLGLEYLPSRNKLAGNLGGNSPGVQGNGSIIQTYSNPGGPPPFNGPAYYNFHTAQVTLSYTPDFLGSNRRQVESLQAQTEFQQLQLEATYITLASNVVAAALQEASLRAQIKTNTALVDDNEQLLRIVRQQFDQGYVDSTVVSNQELSLAQTRQSLFPLRQQLEQTRDLLRVLAGQLPDEDLPETFTLETLHLPDALPLSLPSQLVQQRPDVRAAEAQLHSAYAQVGAALANRFPQFTINGVVGGAATVPSQMFQSGGGFFNLIGDLTLPLFDGGTLKAREQSAREALAQAAAAYKSAVLTAFQNVADTLHAIHGDGQGMNNARMAEQAAQHTLAVTRQQVDAGLISVPTLIAADESWQQTRLVLTQMQTNQLGDAAALYQALGGGWWNRAGTPVFSSKK